MPVTLITRFRVLTVVVATVVAAMTSIVAGVEATARPLSGPSGLDGPFRVASTLDVGACQSLYGLLTNGVAHGTGNTFSDMTCSQTFPNGLQTPVGVALYYPVDRSLRDLPVVLWTGGILSEPGNYDRLSRMMASRGYVVAVPYDYINSVGYLPVVAAQAVARAAADPRSPLHGRVDLSRVAVAGHSAGGAATLQATSLPADLWTRLIPGIHIVSALAVEPGPVALGFLSRTPTLYLTGYNDFIVPHYGWARWTQYELTRDQPAYFACVRGVGHLQPVDDVDHDPLAPSIVRWLDYTVRSDADAASWFVGPRWKLHDDPQMAYVLRNDAAASLR